MKNLIVTVLAAGSLLFGSPTLAEVREGKAVFEISEKLGFKLKEKARQNIGLETKKIANVAALEIPASAIVNRQDRTAVYRLRDGWFKLIVLDSNKSARGADLKNGDELVVNGAGLLRVAEMDAFGGEQ